MKKAIKTKWHIELMDANMDTDFNSSILTVVKKKGKVMREVLKGANVYYTKFHYFGAR